MVLYRVYSEPLLRDYYSTVCSRATIFIVAVYILILIPPALIAYATNDLWLSVSSYREQPDVLYLNQCIVLLGHEGSEVSSWSIFPNYVPPPDTTELSNSPNITFSEKDTDNDGVSDKLTFSIDFSILSSNVTSVQLLLFFRVKLRHYSLVDVESVAYISHSGASAISRLWIGGDLVLNQRTPLPATGHGYNYDSLVNTSSNIWQDYELSTILYDHNQRDLTTVLHPMYPIWQYDAGEEGFILLADVRYTEQTLLYRPSFWEKLKWAWMQYLAIALIFWWSLSQVKSFVFQNHIIPHHKTLFKLNTHTHTLSPLSLFLGTANNLCMLTIYLFTNN